MFGGAIFWVAQVQRAVSKAVQKEVAVFRSGREHPSQPQPDVSMPDTAVDNPWLAGCPVKEEA